MGGDGLATMLAAAAEEVAEDEGRAMSAADSSLDTMHSRYGDSVSSHSPGVPAEATAKTQSSGLDSYDDSLSSYSPMAQSESLLEASGFPVQLDGVALALTAEAAGLALVGPGGAVAERWGFAALRRWEEDGCGVRVVLVDRELLLYTDRAPELAEVLAAHIGRTNTYAEQPAAVSTAEDDEKDDEVLRLRWKAEEQACRAGHHSEEESDSEEDNEEDTTKKLQPVVSAGDDTGAEVDDDDDGNGDEALRLPWKAEEQAGRGGPDSEEESDSAEEIELKSDLDPELEPLAAQVAAAGPEEESEEEPVAVIPELSLVGSSGEEADGASSGGSEDSAEESGDTPSRKTLRRGAIAPDTVRA
jgi:hypothetical protein